MAVFTFLFCFLSSISPMLCKNPDGDGITNPPSFYLHDEMGWRDKEKIMQFCVDLFKHSLLRMRQIIEIRDEHDIFIAYNVGMLMGRIREKFRFMTETYRELVDRFNNASFMYPPGVRIYRPLHFIIGLERMHYLELEIDKLVDVMVDEAHRDVISNRSIVGQTDGRPRHSGREFDLNFTRHTPPPRDNLLREAAEKSFMRERFLMKKLGKPANMTTAKKRFIHKWPVEESWALDKYNQDYK